MNLFQMKTKPEGQEMVHQFIKDNFVSIGYPDMRNLGNLDKDDIREELSSVYGFSGNRLGTNLGNVNTFVNVMNIGDIVLILEGEWVHFGKVGKYSYKEEFKEELSCHRRDVLWLTKVQKYELNEHVKELLRNRGIITKFKHPLDIAELDNFIDYSDNKEEGSVKENGSCIVNENDISKALANIIEALDSENEEIRVNASINILKVSKIIK